MVKNVPIIWAFVLVILCSRSMLTEAKDIKNPPNNNPRLQAILDYITSSWSGLTRSTLTCKGIADPKFTGPSVLYVPVDMPIPPTLSKLSSQCGIRAEHLPSVIRGPGEVKRNGVQPPGLLFLEHPYVVPGGRFNEMYGWDSYFIIRGLLRTGDLDLARGMVDNFLFEIEHYGAVLNANRTYYLTRSQPPFLSSMITAVYEADKASGKENRAWLAQAYRDAVQDYQMWISEPHLAGATELSRYYDFGEGPAPEGLHDEVGYYRDVLAYLIQQNKNSPYLVEATSQASLPYPQYSLPLCEDPKVHGSDAKCRVLKVVGLSPDYYKGDRSMRESGFDITFRFGPYGADTHHYAPVCLNSLLYKVETDLEQMSEWLGDQAVAAGWRQRAEKRQKIIQTLLWDGQRGLFFDYHFPPGKLSSYEYASTFYPLWVGAATADQARAVVNNLPLFEHEGGLAMSTNDSGVQWDYPYGWAPIQLLAVEGLRRYGYNAEADRISLKFLSMVLVNFERDANIREKYNVVTDSSNIKLAEGYRDNIIGFGWTNAVFLELVNGLPPDQIGRIPTAPGSTMRSRDK
jgi:alpha,alpha-trehalase